MSLFGSGHQHAEHFTDPEDTHHPLQVIGKDVETHLRAHARERLGQEVRPTHPVLDRAKRVFDGLAPYPHLLGIAIERFTGAKLSDWPLSEGLGFGPPPGPAVATEHCTWRGRVLRGEVHDENASALGGAAGHAGLFGTVDGVLDFARGLLDGSGASPAMIEAIRTRVHADRTCGWESRFDGWHGGDSCSAATIGHTGFTGTGLWVDFERGLAWTLLTNRVHPTRHRETGIAELRRATGDAVIDAWT